MVPYAVSYGHLQIYYAINESHHLSVLLSWLFMWQLLYLKPRLISPTVRTGCFTFSCCKFKTEDEKNGLIITGIKVKNKK